MSVRPAPGRTDSRKYGYSFQFFFSVSFASQGQILDVISDHVLESCQLCFFCRVWEIKGAIWGLQIYSFLRIFKECDI